jgi:hypothetical protein
MTNNTTQNPNATLTEVISAYGNGLAFGLSGTKEQIERAFNRWFNIGVAGANVRSNLMEEGGWATSGETLGDGFLHFIGENFAYFLTTKEDIVRGLTWENVRLWQDTPIAKQYKRKNEKFMHDARQAAIETFNAIKHENFMGWATDREPEGHAIREGQSDWCPND